MKIVWLSDLHMNFLTKTERRKFFEGLKDYDIVIISGDIGEYPCFVNYLIEMEALDVPIYFVLGNHDFYKGSIKNSRQIAKAIHQSSSKTYYLTGNEYITINTSNGKHAILGHDGWADGKAGNFMDSNFDINDFHCINEFIALTKVQRLTLMEKLAQESVVCIGDVLVKIFLTTDIEDVLLVTHVPPFEEALISRYENKEYSNPFYCNTILGDRLKEIMKQFPIKFLTVLCGHTHIKYEKMIGRNIKCYVNGSDYKKPLIKSITLL